VRDPGNEDACGRTRGEHRNNAGDRQLRLFLGKAVKAAGKHSREPGNGEVEVRQMAQSDQTSPFATAPDMTPKPANKRVGERGFGCVSVEEASAIQIRKVAGCSFTRKIELLPRQMEAASVLHVECPECLAVREIRTKGENITFSWHVKRVTTGPNNGMRGSGKEASRNSLEKM